MDKTKKLINVDLSVKFWSDELDDLKMLNKQSRSQIFKNNFKFILF